MNMFITVLLIVAATFAPIYSLPTPLSVVGDLRNLANPNQPPSIRPGQFNNLTTLDYFIAENCADRNIQISQRLDQIRWMAQVTLANTRLYGVQSDFGFTAMFKQDEAQQTVMTILDHIVQSRGKKNLRPRPDTLSSPRLSCVTEESAKLYAYLHLDYDPWHRCLVGGPRSTPIPAFYAEGTIFTFLCPAFFTQPPMSTRKNCPSVTDNKFSGDSGTFYGNYQTYTLLYQLIRFYLGENALTYHTDPKEQLDWNSCVALSTVNSVLNPTNLEIYIALVSQRCTRWPNPFAPPFPTSDLSSSNLTSIGYPLSSTISSTL